MTPFPREGFRALRRYTPIEDPVEIELSDNTNLWGCHPDALGVMRDAVSADISNYPQAYSSVLRDAVADTFDVPAECVITGCGSDDVLDSTFRAVCDPGARVAFPDPTFLMIPHLLVVNSLRGVPLGDARRPPSPRQLLDADADLIYVCTPNNPTGTALSRAWIDELLDGVGSTGPVVILDEAYYEFNVASPGYDAGDTSHVERALAVPRIMIARTFSKAYGLAGLRAGFGIAHPDLLGEVEKARGPLQGRPARGAGGGGRTARPVGLARAHGARDRRLPRTPGGRTAPARRRPPALIRQLHHAAGAGSRGRGDP